MTDSILARRSDFLLQLFAAAPMKQTFEMLLSFDHAGDAHFTMPYDSKFTHSLHDTHGGVIATLLDNAGWFTAATRYDTWVNTSDLMIRLLEPAQREALHAKGKVIRAGAKLCVTTMEVRTQSDRLIATGSGTFVVSKRPLKLPIA